MRIVQTSLQTHEAKNCKTRMVYISPRSDDATAPVYAQVYKLDNPTTLGYLPSKVWHDGDDFKFVYYVSPALPPHARPFGDKPAYAFTIRSTSGSIEYDAALRIFIDQIVVYSNEVNVTVSAGMAAGSLPLPELHYVFIFGEDQLKNVLTTDWDGNKWPLPDDLGVQYE